MKYITRHKPDAAATIGRFKPISAQTGDPYRIKSQRCWRHTLERGWLPAEFAYSTHRPSAMKNMLTYGCTPTHCACKFERSGECHDFLQNSASCYRNAFSCQCCRDFALPSGSSPKQSHNDQCHTGGWPLLGAGKDPGT